MCRLERRQAPQCLQPLPLGSDGLASPELVRRDDDVDKPLEEIALLGVT